MKFILNASNTFCISLDSKKDRWYRMQRRFQYLDMEVTKWHASTVNEIVDIFNPSIPGRMLRNTEMACAQSHIHIWKHMISHQITYALILEDDACFDKKWKHKLESFDTHQPWHILLLNALGPSYPYFQWNRCQSQWLAGGYLLHINGAKLLLEMFEDNFTITDIMTRKLQQVGYAYTYFPWLIIQEGIDSDNGNDSMYYLCKSLEYLHSIDYKIHHYI